MRSASRTADTRSRVLPRTATPTSTRRRTSSRSPPKEAFGFQADRQQPVAHALTDQVGEPNPRPRGLLVQLRPEARAARGSVDRGLPGRAAAPRSCPGAPQASAPPGRQLPTAPGQSPGGSVADPEGACARLSTGPSAAAGPAAGRARWAAGGRPGGWAAGGREWSWRAGGMWTGGRGRPGAASMVPSPRVGWAWMVARRCRRTEGRPQLHGQHAFGDQMLAPGPITWTPSTWPVVALGHHLDQPPRPRRRWVAQPRPRRGEAAPTATSWPASLAAAWSARRWPPRGWVKVAAGTWLVVSPLVVWPATAGRRQPLVAGPREARRSTRPVTSPTAWTPGTPVRSRSSTSTQPRRCSGHPGPLEASSAVLRPAAHPDQDHVGLDLRGLAAPSDGDRDNQRRGPGRSQGDPVTVRPGLDLDPRRANEAGPGPCRCPRPRPGAACPSAPPWSPRTRRPGTSSPTRPRPRWLPMITIRRGTSSSREGAVGGDQRRADRDPRDEQHRRVEPVASSRLQPRGWPRAPRPGPAGRYSAAPWPRGRVPDPDDLDGPRAGEPGVPDGHRDPLAASSPATPSVRT
mgnify:CR=1 FL=1